jgi:hypothetical protein
VNLPRLRLVVSAMAACAVTACTSTHLEPPEVQGRPALIDDAGTPRIWVVSKTEEVRQVVVFGGGQRRHGTRTDTFFHFEVEAFDPRTARPLWKQRVLTLGDPEASGMQPSRVIGSAVGAQIAGQDGDVVWMLIGAMPYALSASDGRVLADGPALEQRNPMLAGLLPSDASGYAWDKGLVLQAADARRFVIRGSELRAENYVRTPPPPAPEPPRYANGRERVQPTRPFGESSARQVTLAGRLIGLYSDVEAADAADDEFGDNAAFPYSITDQGREARRTFFTIGMEETRRFDDVYPRIVKMTPIDGAPTYLKGRFVRDPGQDFGRVFADPDGVIVWHSTRMDSAGRLALSRLDANLRELWRAELPLSESSTVNTLSASILDDRLVVTGLLEYEDDARVQQRESQLLSVDLATGKVAGWSLNRRGAIP